jgi:hypothetical protein
MMGTYPLYPQEDPESQKGTKEPSLLERYGHLKPYFWQGKIGPAFWTIGGLFSLTLNVILIIALILIGRELFSLKTVINEQLITGLADNFALMDKAVIATTVNVEDTIPVQFTLPVKTETMVVLTADTYLQNASVSLSTGGLRITDAPTDIILRAGTELPVNLDILVPVDTTVPVELVVVVEIPLQDTQLHTPFVGLQDVVSPYNLLLSDTPSSWEEAACATGSEFLCRVLED